jgi:hypothetical protein
MRKIMALGAGVALTLAPALAFGQSGQSPSSAPSAQSPSSAAAIPDDTINKTGAALHDVVQVNQKYVGEMQSASPAQKQALSAQANAEAVQAIQSHGLSVEQYTSVIRTAQNDPQLKQRLLSAADRGQ